MIRWPVAAFVALVIATVGAFFVTQHLKVSTPLINGFPAPVPATIDPLHGGTCPVPAPHGGTMLRSFRSMTISFWLQNRSDNVDFSILNADQMEVRRVASGVFMRAGHRHSFTWNGRLADGRVAPDGIYTMRIYLEHQARGLRIANQITGKLQTVTVRTHPPALQVTAVTPAALPAGGGRSVTIRYTGDQGLRPRVLILRAGRRRILKNYAATSVAGHTLWNGTLAGGRPAPPGTYLVALRLPRDRTCETVQSPLTAAAAPHALVTVP